MLSDPLSLMDAADIGTIVPMSNEGQTRAIIEAIEAAVESAIDRASDKLMSRLHSEVGVLPESATTVANEALLSTNVDIRNEAQAREPSRQATASRPRPQFAPSSARTADR